MATFTWIPVTPARGTVKHRVRTAQFGDGYEQSVSDGINTRVQSWELEFVGETRAMMQAICAFLDARGGHESFTWTPPGGTAGYYVVREYQVTPHGSGLYTIAATFQEVFRP